MASSDHMDLNRPGLIPSLVMAQLMVILPLMQQIPFWISLVSMGAIMWRFLAHYRNWQLPNKWIRLILGMLGVAGVILQHKALFSKEAGLSLFVLMTSFRMLELFKYRDGMNSLFLNLFLLSINFLYVHSMLMAAYAFLVTLWIFMTLNGLQRVQGMPNLKTGFSQSFKILLIALPMTLVMFVFFPRLSHPLWQIPHRSTSGSGVSDSMTPGDISTLTLDDSIAFRIRFLSKHPPVSQLYFRGLVLSKFDGLTWSRTPPKTFGNLRHRGSPVIYEIMLEPHQHRWLFYLDMPQKSRSTEYLQPKQNEQFVNELPQKLYKRLIYRGQSYTDYMANEFLTKDERNLYLGLPPQGNKKSIQWAQQLRSKVKSNSEFINAILEIIHQQPFYYTLTPPILAEEGIDDFWFNTRKGFCEHYASAFTFMARAAGIPARVVIGYQGAQKNPFNDDYLVRQSSAHAWAEIWIKGRGWIRVDPTAAIAPSRVEKNATASYRHLDLLFDPDVLSGWAEDQGLFSNLRLMWDAVNSKWQKWVIGFNRDSQTELLKFAGFETFSWRILLRAMVIFSGLILGLWLLTLIKIVKPEAPIIQLYKKLCLKFEKLGFPKKDNEAALEYWQRINQNNPQWGQQSKPLISTYVGFRFAEIEPSKQTLLSLQTSLREINSNKS